MSDMSAERTTDDLIDALRHSLAAGVTASECGFFFDFDGTLAPIQLDPETVAPVPGVVARLAALTDVAGVVALVSARPVRFLASHFAGVEGLRYFGVYGLETASGTGEVQTHPLADSHARLITALAAKAERELPQGASVERKRVTVALHYRSIPHRAEDIAGWAAAAAAEHGLTVQAGRMVYELKPQDTPTKGSVVAGLCAGLRFAWCFGDDIGDVAAFQALRELRETTPGFDAVLVAIHNSESGQELESLSDLVLDAPSAIPGLLDRILDELRDRPA